MLDAGREYSLQQTLDEHSSSITAVKFAGRGRAIEIHSATYDRHLPCPPTATCILPPWEGYARHSGMWDSSWPARGWMERQVEYRLLVQGTLSNQVS